MKSLKPSRALWTAAAVGAMVVQSQAQLRADIEIPSGTKISCRLEQTISSATAEEGQPVQLTVTEAVMVNGIAAIPQGSSVQGTVVQAMAKRRMGRTGKLDFSIDKVRAADGQMIPLRYTLQKKEGGGHGVRTGVITAGAAVVFWPAAPFFLLMKGKDITINRGMVIDVFTDQNHMLRANPSQPAAAPAVSQTAPAPAPAQTTAVVITSDPAGADIEVDGVFIGSTPSARRMTAGLHRVTVRQGTRIWERQLQVQSGDSVTLHASLGPETAPTRRAAR